MAGPETDPLTFWQAVLALTPLVGAGGISGIIIAVLGYRKAQKEGRPAGLQPASQTGLAVMYAEQASLQTLGLMLERLAAAMERLAKRLDDIDCKAIDDAIEEVRRFRHFLEEEAIERRRRRQ